MRRYRPTLTPNVRSTSLTALTGSVELRLPVVQGRVRMDLERRGDGRDRPGQLAIAVDEIADPDVIESEQQVLAVDRHGDCREALHVPAVRAPEIPEKRLQVRAVILGGGRAPGSCSRRNRSARKGRSRPARPTPDSHSFVRRRVHISKIY